MPNGWTQKVSWALTYSDYWGKGMRRCLDLNLVRLVPSFFYSTIHWMF